VTRDMGKKTNHVNPDDRRTIKTSVILSPHVIGILDLLVNSRLVLSRSEAIDRIIKAWKETDKGKQIIAGAGKGPKIIF